MPAFEKNPDPEPPSTPCTVTFILLPGFKLFDLGVFVDALQAANKLTGTQCFSPVLTSLDGQAVTSATGIPVSPGRRFSDMRDLQTVVLLCDFASATRSAPSQYHAIKTMLHKAKEICAVGSGVLFLARCGLLNGRRAAVHWSTRVGAMEATPEVRYEGRIYLQDGNIMTGAGGEGTVDAALHVVRQKCGALIARTIGDCLNLNKIRTSADSQPMPFLSSAVLDPVVLEAARWFMGLHETEIRAADVAGRLGVTVRQLQRLFRKHVGMAPQRYAQMCRLENARQLLRQTSLSVTEVAIAAGFESSSHFGKRYKDRYGRVPSRDRSPFQEPA